MEQRSCGMRIAVTEREAIRFNAKRAIEEVHGMSMKQRSCGMRIAVTEREAIRFNAKREIGSAGARSIPFNAKRVIKEVHGNDILKSVNFMTTPTIVLY